jgi:5-epi-alpha-selinene synthase
MNSSARRFQISDVAANRTGLVLSFDPRHSPEGRPRLVCSIPPAINPHLEHAQQHSLQWVVELGLVHAQGEKFDRFVAARFPWLAARAYPEVEADQLAVITDWITFVFFFDDMCDTQAAIDPDYMVKLVAREDRLIALARGAQPSEADSPLDRALVDILRRVGEIGSPFWQQRLAAHIQEYLEGCRWERLIRMQGRIPRLATYSKLRLLVSAVFPCFDFAGLCIDAEARGVGRGTSFLDNVYVEQLEVMANNHICWVNDIYGLDKELGEQTTSNLVVVLASQHDLTWDQALDRAIDMCNSELEAFAELAQQLEQLGDPDCRAYVRALESWMRGNLDWYVETRRYQLDGDQAMAECWSTWTRWTLASND